jgi:serine/threonine protein kinase
VDPSSTNLAQLLFDEAIDLPLDARRELLDCRCGDDDGSVRAEVESLLRAYEDAGDFFSEGCGGRRDPDELEPHRPGTRIGSYELVELIGEGGFARVFRARQTHPVRREVALKIVKLGMDTRALIARFELERQALAMMVHPNIAAVYDAGATETGRPYFVMELILAGERITAYCDAHGLDVRHRIGLFINVCHAVQHAHTKGVLHRDLKPSNILVTTIDGRAVPKIIDFGIAKAVGEQRLIDGTTTITHEQQLLGTPRYMSPEQARSGGADVDTRSDIYSLGAVLYELLAGCSPLDDQSGASTALAQLQRLTGDEELPPPSARAKADWKRALRAELDWIVGKCLERDRARRYASAAALALDLQAYLDNRAVTAAPPTLHYRARKFVRRNTVAVISAATILATLLGAAIISTTLAIRAIRAERLAQRRQEETKAVNDFLNEQIIGAASPYVMKANREMTLREALDNASRNVAGQFSGRPLIEAAVRESIAGSYRRLGLPELALPHAARSLELRRQELGPDHFDTLDSQTTYAEVLRLLNRLPEAEALFKDAVERFRRTSPKDNIYSINALENYGTVLANEGRYRDAEAPTRAAAEKAAAVLGPDNAKTLAAASAYAQVLSGIGDVARAEHIYADMYERSLRTQGPDNPDTITLMANRAGALKEMGRYAEAEPLFKEAVDRDRRVWGEDHSRTLLTQRKYAGVIAAMGRNDEALPIFKDVYERSSRTRREDDPQHIDAINDYAVTLLETGRHAEAEPLLNHVVELRRRAQGENHPMTLHALSVYGMTLTRLGRHEEAEALQKQVLTQRRQLLGDDNPLTVRSLSDYAFALTALNRYADAEPICAELFEKAKRVQIPAAAAAVYLSQYGPCLVALGRYEQAEAPLREAYQRLRETNQSKTTRMRRVLEALIQVSEHGNRSEEVTHWRAELEQARATTRPATRG